MKREQKREKRLRLAIRQLKEGPKEKEGKTREEFGNEGGESLCLDLEESRELEGRGCKRSCHGL